MDAVAVERSTESPLLRADALRMGRIAEGDERAFRDLYEEHQPRLQRLAYGVLLDRQEAREVVQEAFLALHQAAPRWRPDAQIGTWLYRVVLNRCLSLRARLVRLALPRGRPTAGDTPERTAMLGQGVTVALASLASLPVRQRAIACLFLEAELAPSEIAPLVDATPNAVRVTLHRALQTIRADLAAAGFDALPTPDEPTPSEEER